MRIDVLIGGILGAIGGAALGVLGGHIVESKRYMTKLETEVSKIKAYYNKEKPASESEDKETASDKKEQKAESKDIDEDAHQYRDKVSIYQGETGKKKEDQVNYSAYSAPPKQEKKPKTDIPKRNQDEKPYKITGDDYYNTFNEFAKVKATWWALSHELIDEDETILDVDQTIGFENLVEWPDDGVIFVRNVPLAVDYEITFCDAVYDYDLY